MAVNEEKLIERALRVLEKRVRVVTLFPRLSLFGITYGYS
jgi:hypothetical protein